MAGERERDADQRRPDGEAMLSALRRLAQEDASARMLHAGRTGPGSADGTAGAGPRLPARAALTSPARGFPSCSS